MTAGSDTDRPTPTIRTVCGLFSAIVFVLTLIVQNTGSELPHMMLSGALLVTACVTTLTDRPRRGDWMWVSIFCLLALLWTTSTPSGRTEMAPMLALLSGAGASWVIGLHLGSTTQRQTIVKHTGPIVGVVMMVWLFMWFVASADGSAFSTALGGRHDSGALYVSLFVLALSRLLTVPPSRGSRNAPLIERWSETAGRRPTSVALAVLAAAAIAQTNSGPVLAMSLLAVSGLFALQAEARKGTETFPFGRVAVPALLVIVGFAGLLMIIWMVFSTAGISDPRTDLSIHMAVVLEALRSSPLLGHGFGSYSNVFAAASTSEAAGALTRVEAAGLWPVMWLVEVGLLGITALSLGFGHVVYVLWKATQRGNLSATLGLILCWIALTCTFSGAGLSEPAFLWLLTFLIAETYAASRQKEPEESRAP